MKQLMILSMVLFALFLQSCRDNNIIETPTSRTYQQDAAILNRFVDINRTTHEYFINPNKRGTALSYITNSDREELNNVSSYNLSIFKEGINRVNSIAGQAASYHYADYIVMLTNNDIYISKTKDNSPITLNKAVLDTRSYNQPIASINIDNQVQQQNIYGTSNISTTIEVHPSLYDQSAWTFQLACEIKENSNKEMVIVLFCGTGRILKQNFQWNINQVSMNQPEWRFITPEVSTENIPFLARVNFYDE